MLHPAASPPGANEFVRIPAGVASVGKPNDFPSYGWDNEYGLVETQWVDVNIWLLLQSLCCTSLCMFKVLSTVCDEHYNCLRRQCMYMHPVWDGRDGYKQWIPRLGRGGGNRTYLVGKSSISGKRNPCAPSPPPKCILGVWLIILTCNNSTPLKSSWVWGIQVSRI